LGRVRHSAGTSGLAVGYGRNQPAVGFRDARNDFGSRDYGGPCPPPLGAGTHHYNFRLRAITRRTLDLTPEAIASEVLQEAQPYVVQQTELGAIYQR
jgi:hypothetical protein